MGAAILRRGREEPVRLEEVAIEDRPPIIRRLCRSRPRRPPAFEATPQRIDRTVRSNRAPDPGISDNPSVGKRARS